jgi:hypothetical protein
MARWNDVCTRCVDLFFLSEKMARKAQVLGFLWEDYVILNQGTEGGKSPSLHTDKIHPSDPENSLKKDPNEITLRMKESLLALKAEHISSTGDSVNYRAMRSSPLFVQYLQIVHSLRFLDLTTLQKDERKAFFLNIYNSLVIHALVEEMVTDQDSMYKRLQMYALAAYQIGPNIYCLNDIEHGILRGNKAPPTPFSSRPFSSNDPRLQFIVDFDPRIHFALNCGARSCPNIKVYVDTKLDRQLQSATQCFLYSILIDSSKKTVTLSMLFKWYREDFGQNDTDILRWIEHHAGDDIARPLSQLLQENSKKKKSRFFSLPSSSSIRLSYAPYDWSINH